MGQLKVEVGEREMSMSSVAWSITEAIKTSPHRKFGYLGNISKGQLWDESDGLSD